jgi:hypothetical protein
MKRLLTFATAAALAAGTGVEAEAQARFDIGVYGGGALTSPWIDHAGQTYSIGPAPIFGLNTTFWTTPAFGVKFHAGYMPSRFPHNNDVPIAASGWPVNNYLLDLSAVFRPWMTPGAVDFMSGLYFWAGGGALVSNPPGDPPPPPGFVYTCVPQYTGMGICYSYQPNYATVGQATAGLGFDIFPLGPLGVFGEIGAHGYSPPLHTTVPNERRDPFAVTGRGVLGLKLGIGDLAPPVVPVPPPPPPPPPPPAPPAAPAERQIQVCVIQNGQLQTVTATFRPATNDTVIGGQAFAQAHPATAPNYAAGANWFIQQQEVTFGGRAWVPFGVTRIIQPPNLQRVGEHMGTPVFAEAGRQAPYEVLYVPVRPGCEFQPYQPREAIRPRG